MQIDFFDHFLHKPRTKQLMHLDEFFFLGQIVLQPTTACNLNCTYCYLPSRNKNLRMQPRITQNLASSITDMGLDYNIPLIWHGGEPLMLGLERFKGLIEPLAALRVSNKITQCLQTNATLINEEWCAFFKENAFEIGVSIDGPRSATQSRRDWQERESFDKIVRGIELLKHFAIPFTCIAVITNESLSKAAEIYGFFAGLGCDSLGINLEEQIGTNTSSADDEENVTRFWRELFAAWEQNPRVQIREFKNMLHWMGNITGDTKPIPEKTDIFPTIGWNGDVALLSPELLGVKSPMHDNFVVGNVAEEPLQKILTRGQNATYVNEYRAGVRRCQTECKFFSYCRGGQASNKFFELGQIAVTETRHCRNSQQKPLETILEFLGSPLQNERR